MLIKRVSPPDLDLTKEVKYMLTADIREMAQLVGVHPLRLRSILRYESDVSKPSYGVARPSTFFVTACNAKRPRALSLSQVDIRAQDGFRLDASESFVIMPLYVMRPSFVGNLETTNGLRYELIPNLRARLGDKLFYQYINLEQPFGDLARDEVDNSEGYEIHHDLMGWDLVMLPDNEELKLADNLDENPPTPKDEENVIFDYGFGVTLEYVYTSDMKDNLRIDHHVSYKNDVVFSREHQTLLSPHEILKDAVQHLNLKGGKEDNFEAYAILRCIRDSGNYLGIGYRRS